MNRPRIHPTRRPALRVALDGLAALGWGMSRSKSLSERLAADPQLQGSPSASAASG
jgi:hypothetical protein